MRWFVLGYVMHIWVTAALEAVGDWYDRRHSGGRGDG